MARIGAVGSFNSPFRHKLGHLVLAFNAVRDTSSEPAGLNQEPPAGPLAMRGLADCSRVARRRLQ